MRQDTVQPSTESEQFEFRYSTVFVYPGATLTPGIVKVLDLPDPPFTAVLTEDVDACLFSTRLLHGRRKRDA